MNIAVVQQQDNAFGLIKDEIDRFGAKIGEPQTVKRFYITEDFFMCNVFEFDVVILDTAAERYGGLRAAKKLRELNYSVKIIVVSDTAKYALDGYSFDISAYILHGRYSMFGAALAKIQKSFPLSSRTSVTVQQRGAVRRIPYSDIYYIESKGHDIIFHTVGGNVKVLYRTMNQLENELCGGGGARFVGVV